MSDPRPGDGTIWECKIGQARRLPCDADAPMREAVRRAYVTLTGEEPGFIFSGWGGQLTEGERVVVEQQRPHAKPAQEYHAPACSPCGDTGLIVITDPNGRSEREACPDCNNAYAPMSQCAECGLDVDFHTDLGEARCEAKRLRKVLQRVADLSTYDIEERDYVEPDEDDMIEALCAIHDAASQALATQTGRETDE